MRKICIFLSTKLTALSRGNQGSVDNIFETGYGKVVNKLSKEPIRPMVSKTKDAEDVKLLGKKPEASEPLLVNVCSVTGKFSRPRGYMSKSLPFPRSCPSVSPCITGLALSCQVYRL